MTRALTTEHTDHLSLTVNGSKLAVGARPGLGELEPALRSVALSDSPVFVRAPEADFEHLLARLHQLGRRAQLPIFRVERPEDIDPLFEILSSPRHGGDTVLGTWALFAVSSWPEEKQEKLGELLETLDLARLHGRLRHERIPRVVVFSALEAPERLRPDLDQRVSYFTLVAEHHQPKEK
jgi:hypothetical protein